MVYDGSMALLLCFSSTLCSFEKLSYYLLKRRFINTVYNLVNSLVESYIRQGEVLSYVVPVLKGLWFYSLVEL